MYWVRVTNDQGCQNADTVVATRNCPSTLWVPSAFTPNHNGLNEYFNAIGFNITKYQIMIFNRWGERLFVSNSLQEGWDGTFQGVLCPEGVYIWVLKYEGYNKELKPMKKTLGGNLTLFR